MNADATLSGDAKLRRPRKFGALVFSPLQTHETQVSSTVPAGATPRPPIFFFLSEGFIRRAGKRSSPGRLSFNGRRPKPRPLRRAKRSRGQLGAAPHAGPLGAPAPRGGLKTRGAARGEGLRQEAAGSGTRPRTRRPRARPCRRKVSATQAAGRSAERPRGPCRAVGDSGGR